MTINCKDEILVLDKDRAIYWESKRMLIISDIHIGKAAYFRKSGVQVPAAVSDTDLEKLSRLIDKYTPEALLITGDMFHHKMNKEVESFKAWRTKHTALKLMLVKGNHDLLEEKDYAEFSIEIFKKEMLCYPFRFVHDQPKVFDEYYNISGHIHPGLTLFGKARQRIKLPCFYFGKHCAILPAFSVFTGLSTIKSEEGDSFYAITPDRVMQV